MVGYYPSMHGEDDERFSQEDDDDSLSSYTEEELKDDEGDHGRRSSDFVRRPPEPTVSDITWDGVAAAEDIGKLIASQSLHQRSGKGSLPLSTWTSHHGASTSTSTHSQRRRSSSSRMQMYSNAIQALRSARKQQELEVDEGEQEPQVIDIPKSLSNLELEGGTSHHRSQQHAAGSSSLGCGSSSHPAMEASTGGGSCKTSPDTPLRPPRRSFSGEGDLLLLPSPKTSDRPLPVFPVLPKSSAHTPTTPRRARANSNPEKFSPVFLDQRPTTVVSLLTMDCTTEARSSFLSTCLSEGTSLKDTPVRQPFRIRSKEKPAA